MSTDMILFIIVTFTLFMLLSIYSIGKIMLIMKYAGTTALIYLTPRDTTAWSLLKISISLSGIISTSAEKNTPTINVIVIRTPSIFLKPS